MTKKHTYTIIFILALIGLGFSIHLLQIDYNVKFNPDYVPECDFNSKISCSKVADSKYSSIFGIPVASLGILGYLIVLGFMLTVKRSKRFFSSLLSFYFIFSVVSIYFFIIAKLKIDALCIFCIGTYIVNWVSFLILLFSVFKFKNDEESFCIKDNFKTFFDIPIKTIPLYLVLIFAILTPSYVVFSKAHNTPELKESDYKGGKFDKENLIGIAGNSQGDVTIILYSDYECPYCARFEGTIKEVINKFSNVKLIRKEFPLDNKCNMLLNRKFHRYACNGAFFAKCAGLEGKFWQAADLLHNNRKNLDMKSLMKYAEELKISQKQIKKCMESSKIKEAVKSDIKEGLKVGVKGTPGYTINGKIYSGAKNFKQLSKLIIKAGGKLVKNEKN
jgi:protein-disulfide isomerase/uncharacterized membrane protein